MADSLNAAAAGGLLDPVTGILLLSLVPGALPLVAVHRARQKLRSGPTLRLGPDGLDFVTMDVTLFRAPTREVVPWSRVRSIEPLGRGAVVICHEGGFPSRTERRIQQAWRLSAVAIAVALMAPPIAAQDPDPAEAWWSAYDDHPPGVYVLPVDSLLPFEAGGREEIETGLEAFDPADRPDRFHAPLPMEWTFDVEWSRPEPGLCEPVDVTIVARSVHVRPDLTTYDGLDYELQEDWYAFDRALRRHQGGHRQIVVSRLTELRSDLQGGAARPCDVYTDTLEALRDRVEQELRERHAAYDEDTDHGRTEGAVWPPVPVAPRPAGPYTLVDPTPLPDSLHEVWAGGRFEVRLVRRAGDDVERELITRAESLVPPEEMIEAAAVEERARGGAARRAQEEAGRRPGDRWWWREWDDVWLPFALTGGAVDHYVTRVRELAAGPNPFGSSADHRASVDYHATIERVDDESAPDVAYEVRMEVDFDFYCGLLCALRFRHTRTVRFDADGDVIDIAGDSRPNYIVS